MLAQIELEILAAVDEHERTVTSEVTDKLEALLAGSMALVEDEKNFDDQEGG